ncbi:nucleotidyltransferase family protein, partial [bacterium]|nr:nucleotidyltransferase family protein [bacterium]
MAPAHLPSDFKEFLKLLLKHQVKYLLVGGYAVAYYGYPRTTADIDIWIESEQQNAERLISALREFGFDTPDLKAELFLRHDHIIQMGISPNRIEIFTSLPGV